MPSIEILPADASRFDDAQHALSGGGDGRSCQCGWWTMPNTEWQRTSPDERRERLRDELPEPDAASPAPALIAYVDGEAAGWVRVGPRTRQVRIGRTKNLQPVADPAWDDPTVWAVSCFVVRREHRGLGLNARLLDAAIVHARDHGARLLEGYPTDTTVVDKRANELFKGVLSTFLAAGFSETGRATPSVVVVSRDLA